MDSGAIAKVGKAIVDRLKAAGDDQVSVHHGGFGGEAGDTLVLIPYLISVNADLRNTEHRVPPKQAGQPEIVYDTALPLDIYFLLCGIDRAAPDTGADLGKAIRRLNELNNIGLNVEGEVVHLSLNPLTTEDLGRLWALFPTIAYRPSVSYLATPVWIDPLEQPLVGPPVVDETYRAPQAEAVDA
jgi:hypothetical protein